MNFLREGRAEQRSTQFEDNGALLVHHEEVWNAATNMQHIAIICKLLQIICAI
jgi:hypothetical protein